MKLFIFIIVMSSCCLCLHSAAVAPVPASDSESFIVDNFKYFQNGVGVDTDSQFPIDHVLVDKKNQNVYVRGEYVSPTLIGLYLDILMLVAEGRIRTGLCSADEALVKISTILEGLARCEKWNGLFYWYSVNSGLISKLDDELISTVDNANLTFSLAALSGAFSDSKDPVRARIGERADALINAQTDGWIKLYDREKDMMSAVYCTKYKPGAAKGKAESLQDLMAADSNSGVAGYYIDRLFTESRLVALWAILASSGEPEDKRVPIKTFSSLPRYPVLYKTRDGESFKVFMTWDGGLFQELLPLIFVDENELSEVMRNNHLRTVKANYDYSMKNKIPSLISSSSNVDNAYTVFGVPDIAESTKQFYGPPPPHNNGTPHASALANLSDPAISMELMKSLLQKYPQIKSRYGWYDSIDSSGYTSSTIIGLDQSMLILALCGKANSDYVKEYLKRKGRYELLKRIYFTLDESVKQLH